MRTHLATLGLVAALAACGADGTFVIVTIEQGSFPSKETTGLRANIELDDGRNASAEPTPPNGNVFLLPSTLSFELRSGAGKATVTALATNQGASLMGSTELVVVDDLENLVTVRLGEVKTLPTDGGVVDPVISLAPDFYDFGVRSIGSTTSQPFVVANTGPASGVLGMVELSTLIPGMNVTTNGCTGMPLATNASCMFTLSFAPTSTTPDTNSTTGLFATMSIAPYQSQGAAVVACARAPTGTNFSLSRSLIRALAQGTTADVVVTNDSASPISLTFTLSSQFRFVATGSPSCSPPTSTSMTLDAASTCNLRIQRDMPGEGYLEVTEGATTARVKVL